MCDKLKQYGALLSCEIIDLWILAYEAFELKIILIWNTKRDAFGPNKNASMDIMFMMHHIKHNIKSFHKILDTRVAHCTTSALMQYFAHFTAVLLLPLMTVK